MWITMWARFLSSRRSRDMLMFCQLVGKFIVRIHGKVRIYRNQPQQLHSEASGSIVHYSSGCDNSSSHPTAVLFVHSWLDFSADLLSLNLLTTNWLSFILLSYLSLLPLFITFVFFYSANNQTPWEREDLIGCMNRSTHAPSRWCFHWAEHSCQAI